MRKLERMDAEIITYLKSRISNIILINKYSWKLFAYMFACMHFAVSAHSFWTILWKFCIIEVPLPRPVWHCSCISMDDAVL